MLDSHYDTSRAGQQSQENKEALILTKQNYNKVTKFCVT